METRICKACGEDKLLSEFPLKKSRDKYYYTHKCKTCRNLKENEYRKRWSEAQIENNKERLRKYYITHKTKLNKQRYEYIKKYRKNNKEKVYEWNKHETQKQIDTCSIHYIRRILQAITKLPYSFPYPTELIEAKRVELIAKRISRRKHKNSYVKQLIRKGIEYDDGTKIPAKKIKLDAIRKYRKLLLLKEIHKVLKSN